jgi:hypothetical protein
MQPAALAGFPAALTGHPASTAGFIGGWPIRMAAVAGRPAGLAGFPWTIAGNPANGIHLLQRWQGTLRKSPEILPMAKGLSAERRGTLLYWPCKLIYLYYIIGDSIWALFGRRNARIIDN